MADFSREEMMRDLAAADAAGDTRVAQHIAGRIKALDAAKPAAPTPAPEAPSTLSQAAGKAAEVLGVSQVPETLRGALDAGKNLVLGAGQLAASTPLFGDRTRAILKETAGDLEKEQAAAPTTQKVARFGTEVATAFLPGAAATRGAGMIPKLAKYVEGLTGAAKLAGTTAQAAGTGAFQGALTPSEDYTATGQAGKGAAWGAGGNVIGAAAGKAWAPFRKETGSNAGREAAEIIERQGLPAPSAATAFDSPAIQNATNALEQIPILGRKVTENRRANEAFLTTQATKDTGVAVPEITPKVREDMVKRLNDTAQTFRTNATATLDNVGVEAQAALAKVEDYAKATSQAGKAKKIERVIESATPTPGPILGPGGQPIPGPPVTKTASELMDLRRAASEIAHKEQDPVLAAQYRQIRDAYDEALKTTMTPEKAAKFDVWKAEWGHTADVLKAADRGMEGGRLLPKNVAAELVPSGVAKRSPQEQFYAAMAQNVKGPPEGWNRALITSLLLGSAAPIGAFGLGAAGGEPGLGTAAGLGIAGLGRHALTANPKAAKAQAEMLRKLLANTAIAGGT